MSAEQPNPMEPGAIVEALLRVLKPEGEFAAELTRAGVNPSAIEGNYSSATFMRFLEVSARHRFPALRSDDGIRELGRLCLEGFSQTILGSVLMAGLTIAGPASAVKRFQKSLAKGRPDLKVELMQQAPNELLITVRGPLISGEFTAGVIESLLKRASVVPEMELARQPAGFDLRARWTRR